MNITEEMTLYTPVEGDGYYTSKALQWVDLCPHMGASEKVLLRVLTNLTTKESPTRKLSPDELRSMIYSGPVDLGQPPKQVSSSGLRRLLRSLAALGQITAPDGAPLTFSSGANAQLRGVSMAIWRYPRHECGCARNAFDALEITRGKPPRFGPTSTDLAATWPEPPADQAGQEVDQAGQEVDQAGQEVDQAGQEVDQDTQGDLQDGASPSSFSCSSSCTSSSSPPNPPAANAEVPGSTGSGREDDGHHDQSVTPSADAPHEDLLVDAEVMRRADELLDEAVSRWGRAHRAPGVRDRRRLAARIAAELVAGGSEPIIIHELTRDMGDVRRAVAVMLGDRTATPGWGRAVDPRPDWAQYEVQGPRPVWCGICDERTRLVAALAPDGSERMRRCAACHPEAAHDALDAAPSGDVPPPPPVEVLAAQLDAPSQGQGGEQPTPQRPARPEIAAVRERLAQLRRATSA